MNITRTSPLTGELNTLDLPLDRQSLHRWHNGEPARDCFDGLSAAQRQFLLAGFHTRRIRPFLPPASVTGVTPRDNPIRAPAFRRQSGLAAAAGDPNAELARGADGLSVSILQA